MTLVDTSVWVDVLQGQPSAERLAQLLDADEVLVHPWVVGELALGSLGSRRASVLADLGILPQAPLLTDAVVFELIAARQLAGRELGWVDANLLGSALLAEAALWTRNASLCELAAEAGLSS